MVALWLAGLGHGSLAKEKKIKPWVFNLSFYELAALFCLCLDLSCIISRWSNASRLSPSHPSGFTTLTYLRVHAQKHHGQEWKDSPGGFGGSASGGMLVCHLCGVHCKTPTQLQGHMGTHTNNQAAQNPVTSNVAASSSITLSNMVTAPTVYVTGNTVVDLLVTDCSSIAAPQPQS